MGMKPFYHVLIGLSIVPETADQGKNIYCLKAGKEPMKDVKRPASRVTSQSLSDDQRKRVSGEAFMQHAMLFTPALERFPNE